MKKVTSRAEPSWKFFSSSYGSSQLGSDSSLLTTFQVDLIHIDAVPGNNTVEYGMDLSEYYLNVEWDILSVPAERHIKVD